MQFTKLRLAGFKSFVEPMEFVIERGLTGIVGPNGCGKSNLVEALRWVMGESSYKNMRASGMEDVIFSGSSARPGRNSAEVTLYLDNSDYSAPPAFNSADVLQVSRRIERDTGSLYRINGAEVRAKDVQLLFADQSTGARSPSMVGQGRVGELIEARPQARRALLEEAAGISGLHSRRNEAELRLRAAEGNLDRLEDIVSELAGRIESLKRQARQASRFKALSAAIRKAEAGLFYVRWREATTQEAGAQAALSDATVAVAEKAEQQMQAARAEGLGKNSLPALRDEAVKAQAAHQRLALALKALEDEQSRNAAREAELGRRLAQLARDMEREEALLKDNADSLRCLAEEEERLRRDSAADAQQEKEFSVRLEMLSARQAETEADLSGQTPRGAALQAEHAQMRRQVEDYAARQKKLAGALAGADAAIVALNQEISQIADMDALYSEVAALEKTLLAAEADVVAAEEATARARRREAQLREAADKERGRLRSEEAEAQTLEKMLSAITGGSHAGIIDDVEVKRGYEIALGAVLGDDLEAALDCAAPVFWREIAPDPADPALPEGVMSLADFVRAPAVLHRRLSQIGVVEPGRGAALQKKLKTGQRLVSAEGALWRWDGLTARADAATAAALRLAQKNRLAELEILVQKGSMRLQQALEELARAGEDVRLAAEAERAGRARIRAAGQQMEETRKNLAALERLAGERVSRRDALKESYGRLYADHEENAARLEDMRARLAALPPADALEKQIALLRTRLAGQRAELIQQRAACEGWRHKVKTRALRLDVIGRERGSWQARLGNAEGQLAELRARHSETAAEIQQLAVLPDDFASRAKALLDEMVKAESRMRDAADRLAKAEKAQTALECAAAEAIEALSRAGALKSALMPPLTGAWILKRALRKTWPVRRMRPCSLPALRRRVIFLTLAPLSAILSASALTVSASAQSISGLRRKARSLRSVTRPSQPSVMISSRRSGS